MIKYDELLYFYLEEKKTLTELSKLFKVTPTWIRHLLIHKCKVKTRSKKESGKLRSDKLLKKIVEEITNDPSISQSRLATKLNISRLTVRRLTKGIKKWIT